MLVSSLPLNGVQQTVISIPITETGGCRFKGAYRYQWMDGSYTQPTIVWTADETLTITAGTVKYYDESSGGLSNDDSGDCGEIAYALLGEPMQPASGGVANEAIGFFAIDLVASATGNLLLIEQTGNPETDQVTITLMVKQC